MTAPEFRTSTFCVSGECVEFALLKDEVLIRHRGDPLTISFTHPEWDVFVLGVRAGEFNTPTTPAPVTT